MKNKIILIIALLFLILAGFSFSIFGLKENIDSNFYEASIIGKITSKATEFIIPILFAEHLDSSKRFVSDIYEDVKKLDGIWSEEIPDGHYIRVSFETPLDSFRDITIYPKIISGSPKIEIYEINENKKIAEFSSLNSNEYNKIYLTDLKGTQTDFDLKVVGGSISIDYIVDPDVTVCGTLSTAGATYTLINNVSSSTDCFYINGDNITLDCNGYWINYSQNPTEGDHAVYTYSDNVIIKNCNIVDGSNRSVGVPSYRHGIYLYEANNSVIFNNYLDIYDGIAIYLDTTDYDVSDHHNITGNIVKNENNKGLYTYRSDYDVVENNTFINCGQEAYYVSASDYVIITNNNFSTTGVNDDPVVYTTEGCEGLIFINNTFRNYGTSGAYVYGLYGYSLENSLFINNTIISESRPATNLYYAVNNTLINHSSIAYQSDAIYFYRANDTIYRDCREIVSEDISSEYDVYAYDAHPNYNNTLINCSYEKEYVEASSDYANEVIRKWYYRAYANYSNGTAIPNVNISAYNSSGDLQFTALTDSNGWINKQEVIDYYNINDTIYRYSNYSINVTMSLAGYTTDNHTFNFSIQKNKINDFFTFGLEGDEVDIIYPTTSSPLSVSDADNISIYFNYLHNEANVTSGVTVDSVFIGGEEAEILNKSELTDTDTIKVPDSCDDNSYNSQIEAYSNWTISGSGTVNMTQFHWYQRDTTMSSTEQIQIQFYFANGTKMSEDYSITINGTAANEWTYGEFENPLELQLGESYFIGMLLPGLWDLPRDSGSDCASYLPNQGTYYVSPGDSSFDASVPTGSQSSYHYGIFGIGYEVYGEVPQIGFVSNLGWQVNVTVPSGLSGYQDLYLNATSNGVTANETETNAINYGGVDETPPYFTSIPENTSLWYGNESLGVDFDADDETGFGSYSVNDTAQFSINSSGWLSNATILAVGNYMINVTIDDSSGNINWTLYTVEINSSLNSCNVLFNETSPITYPSLFTVYVDCGSAFTLSRNGTEISNNSVQNNGVGYFNFSVMRTDTENYTNIYDEEFFTVNQNNEICQVLFNETSPLAYPGTFTVWANCTSAFVLKRNNTVITNNSEQALGGGAYNFSMLRNDTANYSYIYNESMFIITTDTTPPTITFESPTPGNGSTVTENNQTIVANISDASDTSSWIDFDGDLLGYWSMGDYTNSSGIFDNSSYDSFGTFGGNLGTDNITDGKRGNALEFDGSTSYVDIPSAKFDDFINVSVSLWFYPTSIATDYSRIIQKGDSSGATNGFIIAQDDTEAIIGVYEEGSSTEHIAITNNVVQDDNWYHVVLTYDEINGATIYLNGTNDTTSTSGGWSSGTGNNLNIGKRAGESNSYFAGSIDEVLIFNRSLSATEVSALYSSQVNKFNASFDNLEEGQHNYTVYAIDEEGNINDTEDRNFVYSLTDDTPPYFTSIPENASLWYGNESLGVDFDATDAVNFDSYSINDTAQFSINSSGWLSNATSLAVGNYMINVTINDTFNNINWTLYTVEINSSHNSCNVLFNETSPLTYPTQFEVYTNCGSGFTLYRNGSVISNNSVQNNGVGYYNFSVMRIDTENYTNIYDEEFFTINSNSEICEVLYDESSPLAYPGEFYVWANCTSSFVLKRNNTIISNNSKQELEIGAYNFSMLRDDTVNYSYIYNESMFRIVAGADTTPPYFIDMPENSSLIYGTELEGDFDAYDETELDSFSVNDTAQFSINSSGWLSNATPLAVGHYSVNVTINDTSNNIAWTIHTVEVNTSSSNCNILFNDTSPVVYPETFLVYTDCDSTFSLYRNGTPISNNSEQFLEAGLYNFTVMRTDTTNYSNVYDEENFLVSSAPDTTPPYFTSIPADDSITYGSDWNGVDFDADDETGFGSYSVNDH